jgi:hypothetical protein
VKRTATLAVAAAALPIPSPFGEPPPQQPPPAQQQPSAEAPAPAPSAKRVRLSDERRVTRWAHPADTAPVRTRPNPRARAVARLRWSTEDGRSEVYLALQRYGDWVQVRLPMRPNGRTGWVRRSALGRFHLVRTFLRVDQRHLRATLYRSGERIWSAPVGVGKRGTGTPSGHFYVRERIPVRAKGSLYGPLAFGTSAYSTLTDWPGGGVVGIHGTNEPRLIPGRPSHGCVRLRNGAILRLGRLMPVGTPVRIG